MYYVKARYLGGHPAAVGPERKVMLKLSETAIVCESPAFTIPTASITAAQEAFATEAPVDYKASPFMGLFGGLKAQGEDHASTMMRQQDRIVTLTFRLDDGPEHKVRITRVSLEGRSRSEVKADMAAGDWNGARRFVNLVASWRAT